jgi:hypothetical protein
MAIESTDAGIMVTGEEIKVFQALRVASALGVEVSTRLTHSRGSIMNLAKQYCGSSKRTKAGVYVDYAIWLAGYGLTPPGIDRIQGHLSEAQRTELRRGVERARKLASTRKEKSTTYTSR